MLDARRLRYLAAIALQPPEEWEGFYHPAFAGSNLEYLFQIAFAGYALAAMQRQVPAWCGPDAPFARGLTALCRRMLHPRTWRYWARRNGPDPINQANIMYSGHLSCLLSLEHLLNGSSSFASGWDFYQPESEPRLPSTPQRVAHAIHRQMVSAKSHGVACEPDAIYVCCNNHAALSNLLYDRCYPGENLCAVNAEWGAWVRQRMVLAGWHRYLPGPPGGILSAIYSESRDFAVPFASNFTDAWGLALMTAYEPELASELASRLWQRLHHHGDRCFLPSLALLNRYEASDEGLTTGFAALLARELGEISLADTMQRWADQELGARRQDGASWYTGRHSALYTTALFTLAAAIEPDGLAHLFRNPPAYDRGDTAIRVAIAPFPQAVLTEVRRDDAMATLELVIDAPGVDQVTLTLWHLPDDMMFPDGVAVSKSPEEGVAYITLAPKTTSRLTLKRQAHG